MDSLLKNEQNLPNSCKRFIRVIASIPRRSVIKYSRTISKYNDVKIRIIYRIQYYAKQLKNIQDSTWVCSQFSIQHTLFHIISVCILS